MPRHTSAIMRCDAETSDGRRCWLSPGHQGKHLVLPAGAPAQESISRILRSRPDARMEDVAATIMDEMNFRRWGELS